MTKASSSYFQVYSDLFILNPFQNCNSSKNKVVLSSKLSFKERDFNILSITCPQTTFSFITTITSARWNLGCCPETIQSKIWSLMSKTWMVQHTNEESSFESPTHPHACKNDILFFVSFLELKRVTNWLPELEGEPWLGTKNLLIVCEAEDLMIKDESSAVNLDLLLITTDC